MDLLFDDDAQAFRTEVRSWLDENVPAQPLPSMDTAEGFEAHRAWEAKMADAIAGSSYIEMKGIGHLQNLEAPDEFDDRQLRPLVVRLVDVAHDDSGEGARETRRYDAWAFDGGDLVIAPVAISSSTAAPLKLIILPSKVGTRIEPSMLKMMK